MKEIRSRTRYKGFSIKTISRKGKIVYVTFLGEKRIVNYTMSLEEVISEVKIEIDKFLNINFKELTDKRIVDLMVYYKHCERIREHIINQIRN